MPHPVLSQRLAWWRGLLALPALFGAVTVASAAYWPNLPFIGTIARMIESAAPHIAVPTLALSLAIALLGGRRFGFAVAFLAVAGLAGVALRHVQRSDPLHPEAQPVLRVLWYNMLNTNPVPPADLVAALEASPADVILLTESFPLRSARDLLAETFPVIEGCAGRRCDIMVLARDPAIRARLVKMPNTGNERIGVVQLDLADGRQLRLVAAHLLKPWFDGLSASDEWMVAHQASTAPGPVVIVGDFNAAPWSKRLSELTAHCGLRTQRWPIPTWPAAAGRFGIPIDLILTRGGAVLREAQPWGGADLGSNHRGLLFEIGTLPGSSIGAPSACAVPHDAKDQMDLTAE
ncbi:endonuclease/exonuclease/phosphatase family protein [Mangrovicoccus ximenensis]|uniref:endonuclease/exonuclease/phosphatase family protein n=1 Tax=Mangrovicoccus ximenensis TaxID=1911570 RepID=UPI000D3CC223|nr:endonuclease/exonuclease/phosphatase family protein [Mangrovicoccus ximenensis]